MLETKPFCAGVVKVVALSPNADILPPIGPFELNLPYVPLAFVLLPCKSDVCLGSDIRVSLNFVCGIGVITGRSVGGLIVEPFSIAVDMGGSVYEALFAHEGCRNVDEFHRPEIVNE